MPSADSGSSIVRWRLLRVLLLQASGSIRLLLPPKRCIFSQSQSFGRSNNWRQFGTGDVHEGQRVDVDVPASSASAGGESPHARRLSVTLADLRIGDFIDAADSISAAAIDSAAENRREAGGEPLARRTEAERERGLCRWLGPRTRRHQATERT